MSKDKRGRALIINIERFNGPNALDITRHGSRVDVQNLSLMLEAFKFELAPVQENLTAQVTIMRGWRVKCFLLDHQILLLSSFCNFKL